METANMKNDGINDTDSRRVKPLERSSQLSHEDNNPCFEESKLSLKCLSDNDYDRDKCSLHFQNYKNCMSFWNRVSRDRRHRGIKPFLPPPEERPSLRQEYYVKWSGTH